MAQAGDVMERRDFVLAAMSPAGTSPFTPVQVQKLLFLLDRNVSEQIRGPYFRFEPYDYGPFDRSVYIELDSLQHDGLIEIHEPLHSGPRTYRLTHQGHEKGEAFHGKLPTVAQLYVKAAVDYVRSLTFAQLVAAIYQAYPEMRENSVFVQAK